MKNSSLSTCGVSSTEAIHGTLGGLGATFRRVGGEIEDDLGEEAEAAASARTEVRLDRNPGLSDLAADGAGRRRITCKPVR
ncbi:MAG: hypothetical protein F4213_21725 [Boseongicola sp. SB0677_bin_26]|nr:hypothetical protein [Boseongicola sp. SB0665_bin_10]MYG28600.1 hypothetical protein [Boseongicola sp. SB0677_bin_26]